MKNNVGHIVKFEKKLLFILSEIETKDEEAEQIVKNLTSSFLINFTKHLLLDKNLENNINNISAENSENIFNYLDSKNIDYQSAFDLAEKETLTEFITELERDLPPKKITKLSEIVG